MEYRPSGLIDWALSLSDKLKWDFIGCIGTEERSLSAWSHLKDQNLLGRQSFACISDHDSVKYGERSKDALEKRVKEFLSHGGDEEWVFNYELMTELFEILNFTREVTRNARAIVLDITSFPKRFFFPILRELLSDSEVEDLVITYTSPDEYSPINEPLYEEIEPWRTLPGFSSLENAREIWIVSVGFLVESLRQYAADEPGQKIKLFIPFPASLDNLRRTWASIAALNSRQTPNRFDEYRVDPCDVSAAFDRINMIAGESDRHLAFAPFGPKPISVAMCLYAIQKGSSVHYPQPTVYHPEYTRGVRGNDPARAVHAYWIKHGGKNLYAI